MYKRFSLQCMRAGIVLGSILLCYFAANIVLAYAYPFIIALFLAFLLHPIVTFLERWLKMPRPLATILAMTVMLVISLAVMMTIIAELTQGMVFLAERMPVYFENGAALFNDFVQAHLIPLYDKVSGLFQRLHPKQQDTIEQYLQDASSHAASYGAVILQQFFLKIAGLAIILPSSISVSLFTGLATFFITNEYTTLMKRMKRIFPSTVNRHAKSLSYHFKKGMTGYVKAQLLLVMTSAVIIFAGLLILRIDHALTITLLTAFADLLPLLGTGIVFIPWVIYLLFANKVTLAIILVLLYLFVVLTRQIMEPKVLSSNLGISPLLSLTVLFAAIKLYGGIGLLMTPLILIFITGMVQAGIPKLIFNFIKGPTSNN